MLTKLLDDHIPVDIGSMRVPDFLANQNRIELEKLKNVREGQGWKIVDCCPVCDSTNFEYEFEKHGIPLVKCINCELRFHTKIPSDPNDIYQASEYSVYPKVEVEEHFNYRRNRFGRERIRILEEHCEDLFDKMLLDVGCGDGYFLSVAKEKCKHCVGLEFSKHLRDFAQEKTGVTVYNKSLQDLPERDFNIITMFDVIEHIPDPVQFMQAANKLLAPGGHILIYTPNFDSFSIKVIKNHSSIVDGTEHVILFNHASLEKLGEIVGLEVVHVETRGLDIHNIIADQSYFGKEKSAFLEQWLDELQTMIDASECADYLRIIYRKKK